MKTPAYVLKQRTGNSPGQGRQPTLVKPGERSAVLHARVSPAQRAKVERNGGAQWVRALIDAAPETASLPNQPQN